MEPCFCGNALPYERCCGPIHERAIAPPTAEALMRSRYSAYARKDLEYLEYSWDPQTRPRLSIDPAVRWTGLTILSTQRGQAKDEDGEVEFAAAYLKAGQAGVMKERSTFRRLDGRWVYVGQTKPARKVGRNDPCPCGSGKKYKRCCGR